MLNAEELGKLRQLRVKLLHYWQKFPEESADKQQLNDWQNLLDKIIFRESKLVESLKPNGGNK